ncbi:hypothetical protein MBRA1_002836 [Malassezia brasiliensis]|uniref:Small EDRK-rich factor-like N-terminal domain-containing protein n=1 Tax=Malassezia brasiliensis TaxID=1821822 RepID=A0AAF0IQJ3_9BASI|nr:hypothetical protein MBRA1_002836 [Malassezia brasiliensis]
MTRGNAREIARAKNQKKQAQQNKGKNTSGMSLAQRREHDAAALRAKQERNTIHGDLFDVYGQIGTVPPVGTTQALKKTCMHGPTRILDELCCVG